MKFPRIMFVKVEDEDTADEYLALYPEAEDAAELGKDVKIAMYELKEQGHVSTNVVVTTK